MRLSRLIIPVAALLFAACAVDDGPTVNNRPQLAGVRFINALADEGPVDARMIDQTEWHAFALAINFRQSGPVWPTEAGTRKVRVWRSTTNLDSMALLIEQDVTIEANKNVTLLLTGSVQANTARIEIIPDVVPDSSAGQIHIRAVNTMAGAADVSWVDANGASAPVSVSPLGQTSYQSRAAGEVKARFAAAGAADAAAPKGAPEAGGIGATAGYSTSGSALSAYLFPASVVGSRAPAAFTTPGVVWFVDRVPAPPRS
ncbi:MAG TPA: DUF4397 domain-containing protein [Gemmatimonadales bacterium]